MGRRSCPPGVEPFVVVLEVVSHGDLSQGGTVVYPKAGSEWFSLGGKLSALAPKRFRDVRGGREQVLDCDPRPGHRSDRGRALEVLSGDDDRLALELDLLLEYAKEHRLHGGPQEGRMTETRWRRPFRQTLLGSDLLEGRLVLPRLA